MEATIINTVIKNSKLEIPLPNNFNNKEVEVIVVMKNISDNNNIKNDIIEYSNLLEGNTAFDFLNDPEEDIYNLDDYRK